MLRIVATLEEFWSQFYDKLVHQSPKNNFCSSNMHVVSCWNSKLNFFAVDTLHSVFPNILVDSISRLHCLSRLPHLMERKKLIKTIILSDDEDDKEAFLMDCKFSGLLDDDINTILECYLNLPEIPDLHVTPWTFPAYVNCSRKKIMSYSTSRVSSTLSA